LPTSETGGHAMPSARRYSATGVLSFSLWSLLFMVALLLSGVSAFAQTVVVSGDRATFPIGTVFEGFDGVPAGTRAPFDTGAAVIEGNGEVIDSLVGLQESFWFPGHESPPNFVITNLIFTVKFPQPVDNVSFDWTCFFCGSHYLNYRLYDVN